MHYVTTTDHSFTYLVTDTVNYKSAVVFIFHKIKKKHAWVLPPSSCNHGNNWDTVAQLNST